VEGKIRQPPNRGQVAGTAGLSLGSPFREEDLTRATDRITRLLTANGLYEAKVTPEVERTDQAQQVFITFRVKSGKRAKYDMPAIHGATKLSEAAIIRATGWRTPLIHFWRQVTDSRTRHGVQGIQGKYQQQDRLTARVELQKLDYDPARRRVRPNLQINAGPKIRVKAVEAKVSKRVLKRYVPIYQERAVDNDLLVEGARNLRDYFQSRATTTSMSISARALRKTMRRPSNTSSPKAAATAFPIWPSPATNISRRRTCASACSCSPPPS
jgi:Outer membrane protein/protective antigen OMA87